jgi:hypothetical protein
MRRPEARSVLERFDEKSLLVPLTHFRRCSLLRRSKVKNPGRRERNDPSLVFVQVILLHSYE